MGVVKPRWRMASVVVLCLVSSSSAADEGGTLAQRRSRHFWLHAMPRGPYQADLICQSALSICCVSKSTCYTWPPRYYLQWPIVLFAVVISRYFNVVVVKLQLAVVTDYFYDAYARVGTSLSFSGPARKSVSYLIIFECRAKQARVVLCESSHSSTDELSHVRGTSLGVDDQVFRVTSDFNHTS